MSGSLPVAGDAPKIEPQGSYWNFALKRRYRDKEAIVEVLQVCRPRSRVGPHLEASIVHDWLYVAWQLEEGTEATEEWRLFADESFVRP